MIYLLRHGLTDYNQQHKALGSTDIPLNEIGKWQAEEAAEQFKNINFDICYCSPLTRCRQTADIFLKDKNLPIIYDDRLVEIDFGDYEGTYKVVDHPELPIYTCRYNPEVFEASNNMESFQHLYSRVNDFLNDVLKENENKTVLIISHKATTCCFKSIINNIPLKDFWQDALNNCQLYKLMD